MKQIVVVLFLSLNLISAYSQQKYWISFKDKNINNYKPEAYLSKETIKNRNRYGLPLYQYTDIPVNAEYLQALGEKGIKVVSKSRWINAVSSYLTPEQMMQVGKLPFVQSIDPINPKLQIASAFIPVSPKSTSIAMAQMESSVFLEKGLTGKGINIGVVDAGFHEANTDNLLLHLFKEDKIKQQCDFLDPTRTDIIVSKATKSDYHGRMVLDMICGYDEKEGIQTGMAVNANLYLARTENGDKEYRGEEDKWMEAMEWLDSLGIRLISTSLGYAINMDDPKDNYKKEDMNGLTTRISKAAQIAINDKGIFLVVSAGNEGSNMDWTIITSPADVEGVLSIGATRDFVWDKIGYSSIGPEFLPYLKPNVSCYSPNGTSFSAPAVAGFVACLMEADSTLSNKQLKEVMEKSGHLYPYGNNYIGYGIPLASKAIKLLADPNFKFDNTEELHLMSDTFKIKEYGNGLQGGVVFHKKNDKVVIKQTSLKPLVTEDLQIILMGENQGEKMSKRKMRKIEKERLKEERMKKESTLNEIMVIRPAGAKRSTIWLNGKVTEIIWDKAK